MEKGCLLREGRGVVLVLGEVVGKTGAIKILQYFELTFLED